MPYPQYSEMDDPLLCIILLKGGNHHEVSSVSTYEPLADFFGLTDHERTQSRYDGYSGTKWKNRVQWARQRLINKGYIDGSKRGIWRLTSAGLKRAEIVIHRYKDFEKNNEVNTVH